MQRNSHPMPWRPKGLSDALDASQAFSGSMAVLQNIIPDPSTMGLWQCRPASLRVTAFGSFNTPGFVSALKVIGNLAYGMIASNANPGKDEPFCYDLLANAPIVVTGVTNANSPNSPATTGDWVPPTMALVGAKLVVTHPGFNGGGGVWFGWFDVTNPAAPVWNGGNLTGAITFAATPTGVAQFYGRAYYIYNLTAQPSVIFSDVLNATNVTSGTQVLTFGDNVALTGFGPLALNNQLGGIIQALMVFKGVQNIYQITGDAVLNNLQVNTLNITTGTLAVNTIVTTPKGLSFVSPDGVRIIGFDGNVSEPIGTDGKGVTVPFQFAVHPSRMAAGCNGDYLRISVQNGNAPGSPNQEYWFDFGRGTWSGPHTFPASLIQPYSNTFILTPVGITASLWRSDPVQSGTSIFEENGALLTWNYVTSMLPDTDKMTQNSMTESVLDIALATGIQDIVVNAVDQFGAVMNTVSIATPGGASIWGAFLWGTGLWGGPLNALSPRQLPWTEPINFTRMQMQATGQSAQGLKLGTWHMRYQILRYLSNVLAA